MIIFASFLFLFLAINIYSSATVSPLLTSIVKLQPNQALFFLGKINHTDQYFSQRSYFYYLFGSSFEIALNKDKNNRQQKIKQQLSILEKNPQSRDTLLMLAVLYYQNEDYPKAKNYYSQAKVIDPWIEIGELEKL